MIWASGEGHSEVVKILLTNHADTGLEDSYGKTALIYAAGEGFRNIMEALLASPLTYAVIGGRLDIAKNLLNKGGNANASDNEGKTVLSYAQIVRMLIGQGCGCEC